VAIKPTNPTVAPEPRAPMEIAAIVVINIVFLRDILASSTFG
jgi:hypothetical protein